MFGRRFVAVVGLSWAAAALLGACGEPATPPSSPGGPPAPAPRGDAAGGYGYAGALGSELDRRVGDALVKGRRWLLERRDAATGAWDPKGPTPVGFTALSTLAVIGTTSRDAVATDPAIRASLDFLAAAQRPDGSIYSNPQYVNYETSVAISALAGARVAALASAQAKARDFLVASQIQEDPKDVGYGGFPYKSKSDPTGPPDLSNAQFAATAAADAGVKDAAFWKRVDTYLAKVQNRSETNTYRARRKVGEQEVEVVPGNDGGAYYAPAQSKADFEPRPDGTVAPRSYGSMTYALLKCLLFAGAKPDDPRVVAAAGWLQKHFTVDRNPGFEAAKDPEKAGQQGYFYYLMTMSRALAEHERATRAAGGAFEVRDASGAVRDWRREIAQRLVSLQQADGSWTNPSDRWEEGLPLICTAYALQTLATCQGRLP